MPSKPTLTTKQGSTLIGAVLICLLTACSAEPGQPSLSQAAESSTPNPTKPSAATTLNNETCENYNPNGLPLFGDLHVHTSYSFDAAANSTGAKPIDAQNYARGQAIPFFPLDDSGAPIGTTQIDRPLDFLAVTDHGEFLGERALCRTPDSPVYDTAFCQNYRANERQGMLMLASTITTETPARIPAICGADGQLCTQWSSGPWADIRQAANEANDPCHFTSFIAYEYTGTPGTSNYHRNVIFRNQHVPAAPVSYVDAPIDSKLWAGLDAVCQAKDGCDYLTIPHNTNLANGRMAPYMQLEDTLAAKQAYANKRLQREPIMEIFQHKGGSECINGLSSVFGAPDELCNVEAVRRMGENKRYGVRRMDGDKVITTDAFEVTAECTQETTGANGMLGAGCVHATDFQRSALVVGLAEEQKIGANPIKLGIIAATDTHSANPGGVAENNWAGAVTGEANAQQRLQPGLLTSGIDGNPGGLAGVWAKENTRDAIFDAMLRKEVFGTSGPRITPRLFAGWAYGPELCDDADRETKAYAAGVPMGSDLPIHSAPGAPSFLAYAAKDPSGQNLSELHLIKGWVDHAGGLHTKVIPLVKDPSGAATLCTVYTDAEFDSSQPAYYYLRVVEPASPRWHTFDCARLAPEERPGVCSDNSYPEMIQEMAWTSPIWYTVP